MSPVLPGAEPFDHSGGPVGVLLCHGFTGSPQSLRGWADYLAAQDLTVSLPRLPGHGTTWQDLARTGGDDWFAEVDAAFGTLASRCEQVFVFGLSMGGCLALRVAETRGAAVRGLVLVNPSLAPDTKLFLLAPVLKHVIRSLPGIASDISKPGAHELGYDRVPVRAAATLPKLWSETVRNLSQVTQPVLVYRSTIDHVVGPASMRALLAGLPGGSGDRARMHRQLPRRYARQRRRSIFEGSMTFIQTVTAGNITLYVATVPVWSTGHAGATTVGDVEPPAPSPEMVDASRRHLTERYASGVDLLLWETEKRLIPDLDAIRSVTEAAASGRAEGLDMGAALVLVQAARLGLDRLECELFEAARAMGMRPEAIAAVLELPDAAAAEKRQRWLEKAAGPAVRRRVAASQSRKAAMPASDGPDTPSA